MKKTDYQETLEFIEGILHVLSDDGRYYDFYNDKKNYAKLQKLREGANMMFFSMPDVD